MCSAQRNSASNCHDVNPGTRLGSHDQDGLRGTEVEHSVRTILLRTCNPRSVRRTANSPEHNLRAGPPLSFLEFPPHHDSRYFRPDLYIDCGHCEWLAATSK